MNEKGQSLIVTNVILLVPYIFLSLLDSYLCSYFKTKNFPFLEVGMIERKGPLLT